MSTHRLLGRHERSEGKRPTARAVIRGSAVVATTVAGGLVVASAGPALAAPSGSVRPQISDRQSVQVQADASGHVSSSYLFSQLQVTGEGHYTVSAPTATDGLRNLDGFAAPKVVGGKAVWNLDVHGTTQQRTVADIRAGQLPFRVTNSFTLDGKPIAAKDIVGKTGTLVAKYTVRNVSATPQKISFRDGTGHKVTRTLPVVMPLIGQLQTTLPASFHGVTAKYATLSGDGNGGTIANWQMVLFSPLGTNSQTLTYTAHLDNGSLPAVDVQAIPVAPTGVASTDEGQASIASGASSARQLTSGGTQLDSGLVRLANGTGQLLAGLNKLYAGAAQLQAGLAGQAVPGSHKIAAGLDRADSGAHRIDAGLGTTGGKVAAGVPGATRLRDGAREFAGKIKQAGHGSALLAAGSGKLHAGTESLRSGAAQLSAGASQADSGARSVSTGAEDLAGSTGLVAAGSKTLVSGLQQISGGLGQLGDQSTGLPAALAAAQQLQAGVEALVGGLGDASSPTTVLGGLAQISAGLGNESAGLNQLADTGTGLPAAKAGVDQVESGLSAAATDPTNGIPALQGALAAAIGQLQSDPNAGSDTNIQTALGYLSALKSGLGTLLTSTQQAAAGLQQVSGGLGTAISGVGSASDPNSLLGGIAALQQGASAVTGGVTQVQLGLKSGSASTPGIDEGLTQLVSGLTSAVTGVSSLVTGAGQALPGAQTLSDDLGQLSDGAGQLADGAAQLADGNHQLAAGAKQISGGTIAAEIGAAALTANLRTLSDALNRQAVPGAEKLAGGDAENLAQLELLLAGLTKLHDGSGQLAPGLDKLLAGSRQLAHGLGPAASGAARLETGLGQASAGAQQIQDGLGQARTKGTRKLIRVGNTTAVSYGEQYATLEALDAKAAGGGLLYPAPAGATGEGAYDYRLAAASHQSSDNAWRGIGAIALIVVASVASWALRRRFVNR